MYIVRWLALAFAVFMFVGCKNDPKQNGNLGVLGILGFGASVPSGSESTKVEAANGGIINSTNQMKLTLPANALNENATISYRKIDAPSQKGNIVPIQTGYEFYPHGLQFNAPVSLEICYDPKELQSKGLSEQTVQIHYLDPETQEYVSMGGVVNTSTHCVESSIYHFSSYLLTAQITSIGDNPPSIGGASFFPSTPLVNLPAYVRTSIVDFDNAGAIAGVVFYYRQAGSGGTFTALEMQPELAYAGGNFYYATIPSTDVTAAGLEYYIKAFDSLNKSSTLPANAPTTYTKKATDSVDTTNPIRFNSTVTNITAGFSRDLTVQIKGASSSTYFPVIADTIGFPGISSANGTTSRPTLLTVRYTANQIGTTSINASYGSLSLSQAVNIFPGALHSITLFYGNGAVVPNSISLYANDVVPFDVRGNDAYGNFVIVYPEFNVTGGIGSMGTGGDVGKYTAGAVTATGQVVVSVGTKSKAIDVTVMGPVPVYVQFTYGGDTSSPAVKSAYFFDTANPSVQIGSLVHSGYATSGYLPANASGGGTLLVQTGHTLSITTAFSHASVDGACFPPSSVWVVHPATYVTVDCFAY